MSALALMALLGLAVFLPVFVSDDDDTADNDAGEPAAPAEPDTGDEGAAPPAELAEDAGGLPGNDILQATEEDTVLRGGAGDDLLRSTVDGADSEINGGSGNDTLSVDILIGDIDGNQSSHILTGGSGADVFNVDLALTSFSTPPSEEVVTTITDFTQGEDQLELTVAPFPSSPLTLDSVTQDIDEEAGFTDIRVLYTDPEGIAADIPVVVRVQGVAGLSSEDFTLNDGTLEGIGTDGNDTLSSSGNIRSGEPSALLGLAGDDVLIHEARDSSGPLRMEGGDGNDTLIANEIEFGNATTLDGGAGDDLLQSDIFVTRPGASADTFITGEGMDTIAISFFANSPATDLDLGLVGTVTDFTPGTDMILIDPRSLLPDEPFLQSSYFAQLDLSEDPAGAFTDIRFIVTSLTTGLEVTGLLRLEGLTGLQESDIAIAAGFPDGSGIQR